MGWERRRRDFGVAVLVAFHPAVDGKIHQTRHAVGLLIVLGVASMLDFDQLFLQLHHLIFTNTYWSAEGYMLLLFPGGFWFDAALICIAFMAGLAIISGIIGIIFLKRNPKKTVLNQNNIGSLNAVK